MSICHMLNLFLDKASFQMDSFGSLVSIYAKEGEPTLPASAKNSHSKNTQQTSRAQSHMLGVLTYPN